MYTGDPIFYALVWLGAGVTAWAIARHEGGRWALAWVASGPVGLVVALRRWPA